MCEDQERLPHNVELGRRFWWLLVDLDAQLSLLLGRRPATLSEPDVPRLRWQRAHGRKGASDRMPTITRLWC
jgi:hypothetical protein